MAARAASPSLLMRLAHQIRVSVEGFPRGHHPDADFQTFRPSDSAFPPFPPHQSKIPRANHLLDFRSQPKIDPQLMKRIEQ
jgi:hypothetical protein